MKTNQEKWESFLTKLEITEKEIWNKDELVKVREYILKESKKNLKTKTMKTNQEKWNEIVQRIEELGEELQELILYHFPSKVDGTLLGLRITIDELKEQEIKD